METIDDNHGYTADRFKPGDIVLVRLSEDSQWCVDEYVTYVKGAERNPYQCVYRAWAECIPYEGNQQFFGTDISPENRSLDKAVLFGIEMKPGYVLEFDNGEYGILFPTAKGFAVSYTKGYWQLLKSVNQGKIVNIMGIAENQFIYSGKVLWSRPVPQKFTKAQIAEKLGMNVQDFEITEE